MARHYSLRNNKEENYSITRSKLKASLLLNQARDVVSRARELELNQYNMTSSQAMILVHTSKHPEGLTIAELSSLTLREPHSVSALINRMAKSGLVRKVLTNRNNKIKIYITEKGKKSYSSVSNKSGIMIFSALSPQEINEFKKMLEKIIIKGRQVLGVDFKLPFIS